MTVRTTPSQHSSNTADMQQSINLHLWTPRHPNLSTETAWHTHRTTRIDVLRRQTTHGHTRTNTRKPTGHGWSGGWSGQNRNYWKILHVYVFFQKKWLIPLDRGLITQDTLYVQTHEAQNDFHTWGGSFEHSRMCSYSGPHLRLFLLTFPGMYSYFWMWRMSINAAKWTFLFCCFVCLFMTSFHSLSTAAFASGINRSFAHSLGFPRLASLRERPPESSEPYVVLDFSKFAEQNNIQSLYSFLPRFRLESISYSPGFECYSKNFVPQIRCVARRDNMCLLSPWKII